jgi:hypothetical protein
MSADLMAATLKAIRQRRPNAAVTNLGQLLDGDRDRAVTTLSRLRGENLDLNALSHDDQQNSATIEYVLASSLQA